MARNRQCRSRSRIHRMVRAILDGVPAMENVSVVKHVRLMIHLGCTACDSWAELVMPALDMGDVWRVQDPRLLVWHQSHWGAVSLVKGVVKA